MRKINRGTTHAAEYEAATGWEFDSSEEFHEHFLRYWYLFYPNDAPESAL